MDLHLLHPNGGNSHVANSWNSTWDAAWNNRTPSWDNPGIADDPSLDRDDITGTGPENTRINVPSSIHNYTIGVHMYSRAFGTNGPIAVTVKLYCGGVLRQTANR